MRIVHGVTHGPDGSYPRTLCGLKLERDVIRCHPKWLVPMAAIPDRTICPDCRGKVG